MRSKPATGSATDSVPRKPWWRQVTREAPGLAAIAAVVVLVFWPIAGMSALLVTPEGPTVVSDMVHGAYPGRLLLGQALAKGHLPLWTDQMFCGFPLLAAPGLGTFYPLNWLFVFLPGPAAMSLGILLTCMMAGWFTYHYCRTLGLGRAAATLAGMSFAVCGFFASHARHVAFSQSACWLPLELSLVEKAVRDRGPAGARAALWLAPVVALQCLAGGIQFVYISALAMLVYAPIRLIGSPRSERRWHRFRYALLALALMWGLTLAAEQALPARQLLQVSERSAGLTPTQADPYPMPARDLLTLVYSGAVGRAIDYSYDRRNLSRGISWEDYYGHRTNRPHGLFWEDYIYAGWPVVLLAVVGLPWGLRRWPQARIMLVLGVAGAMLALGERGWLFPTAWRVVPGMSLFRGPTRFLLWTEIATAVLGAMGAEVVLAYLYGRRRLVAAAVLLAATLVDLAVAQSKQNVYYPAKAWLTPPATVLAVRESQALGLQPRVWTMFTRGDIRHYYQLFLRGGWEAHLRDFFAGRALLHPDSNAIWGVPAVSGYVELVPEWTAKVWQGQHTSSVLYLADWSTAMMERSSATGRAAKAPPGCLELLGAANVQYVISSRRLPDKRLEEIPIPGDFRIYRNHEALGRAYLVPGAEDIGSDDNFLALQLRGDLDFRHRVYLCGRASPARADFSAIAVRARDNAALTRVTLEPQAPAACWLVLTDAYYPGWSVTVDGKPAVLERANCTMRAVQLPAGRHGVEFRYRCRPLEAGAAVAAVSGLLWLLAFFLLPQRFPQAPPPEP